MQEHTRTTTVRRKKQTKARTTRKAKANRWTWLQSCRILHRHTEHDRSSLVQSRSGTERLDQGVTINSLSPTRRQAGAEYLLLDSGRTASRISDQVSRTKKVPLLDPGVHTASGARIHHDGGRLVIQTFRRTVNSSAFPCVRGSKTHTLLVVSLSRGSGVIFAQTQVHFFLVKIQTQHSQAQLHKEESLFFVTGMLMAPLCDSWCE